MAGDRPRLTFSPPLPVIGNLEVVSVAYVHAGQGEGASGHRPSCSARGGLRESTTLLILDARDACQVERATSIDSQDDPKTIPELAGACGRGVRRGARRIVYFEREALEADDD